MIRTAETIDRALADVYEELTLLGLMTDRLHAVEVYRQLIDVVGCHGFYQEECTPWARAMGFRPRSIYVPQLAWARVAEILRGLGRHATSLRDVLRHEYGHAFAVEHPSLVRRSRRFREVFGAPYDDDAPDEFDPDLYVTEYAATAAYEDFAETFMVYVKYGGRIQRYKRRPGVYRKLRFVAELAAQVRHLRVDSIA